LTRWQVGLLTRIGALRDNLRRVQEILQQADNATLLGDPVRLAALKWHPLLALEDAFALCNQAVALLGGDAPTAYAECFERLAARGVISTALSNRLQAMARFGRAERAFQSRGVNGVAPASSIWRLPGRWSNRWVIT
jgi:hypothetical protein